MKGDAWKKVFSLEKPTGKSHCCPQLSREKVQRGQRQTVLGDAQRGQKAVDKLCLGNDNYILEKYLSNSSQT